MIIYQLNTVSYTHLDVYKRQAQRSVKALPEVKFHQTINDGLFALYLAEGIKKEPILQSVQKQLLKPLGFRGKFLYCLLYTSTMLF